MLRAAMLLTAVLGEPSATGDLPVHASFEAMVRATDVPLPPVRAVTHGPKFHEFGS